MSGMMTICLPCRLRLLFKLPRASSEQVRRVSYAIRNVGPGFTPARAARRRGVSMREVSRRWIHEDTTPSDGTIEGRSRGEEAVRIQDSDVSLEQEQEQEQEWEVEDMDPESVARAAREAFKDELPEGALTEEQYKIYERLYGPPLQKQPEEAELETGNTLYREDEDGSLEELGVLEPDLDDAEDLMVADGSDVVALGEDTVHQRSPSLADDQLQRDIAAAVAAARNEVDTDLTIRSPDSIIPLEDEQPDEEDHLDTISASPEQNLRAHPFTTAAKFGTSPSALPLPRSSFTQPVSLLLSNISNKHLDEGAARIFEGKSLPYSPSTPASSRTQRQKAIPLSAGQGKMTELEADLYMAAVMPQTYAAVMSVLVEVRKRLGASWLEALLLKEGGPRILDAGAGGAGVIAWREVLKAEWRRMHDVEDADPSNTASTSDQRTGPRIPPTPLGKATVLTGSNTLRARASVLLENTTFLPRLPDYIHTSNPDDTHRKQFDIIVAPHSLWHIQENFERREKVWNLWSLLNPNGGVLMLLEKGVPRGFEVVADARGYLIGQLFEHNREKDESEKVAGTTAREASSLSESNLNDASGSKEASLDTDETAASSTHRTPRSNRRAPGHIIAPCPHESACPLYRVPGVSQARKDYCHFRQRFIRPTYLQRLVGAKDQNHEDVEFSYVAVRKGFELDSIVRPGRLRGEEADSRAFAGFDITDEDVGTTGLDTTEEASSSAPPPSLQSLPTTLPRLLLPPLKRQGHIHLDLCTPSGKFSRWTVPRSLGKQVYRDARKAKWGDLWALGAKQSELRRVRLGREHMIAGIGVGKGVESIKADAASKKITRDVRGVSRPTSPARTPRPERSEKLGKRGKNIVYDETSPDTVDVPESSAVDVHPHAERLARRKEEKARGREKARKRRREETKSLFEGI